MDHLRKCGCGYLCAFHGDAQGAGTDQQRVILLCGTITPADMVSQTHTHTHRYVWFGNGCCFQVWDAADVEIVWTGSPAEVFKIRGFLKFYKRKHLCSWFILIVHETRYLFFLNTEHTGQLSHPYTDHKVHSHLFVWVGCYLWFPLYCVCQK